MFRIAFLILVVFLAGCVSSPHKASMNFTALTDTAFSARKEPAKVKTVGVVKTNVSEKLTRKVAGIKKAMDNQEQMANGYAWIGNLDYDHVVKTCKYEKESIDICGNVDKMKETCELVKDDITAVAKLKNEAAKKGGDIILLSTIGGLRAQQRMGSECINWDRGSPVYQYIYNYSTKSMQMQLVNSGSKCIEFAPAPKPIMDYIQTYQARIFRQDTLLAQIQINGVLFEQTIAENNLNGIKKLIKKGVPIDAPTMDGQVPITLSAGYGNVKAAQILLKNGADIDHITKQGTPLHVAAALGHASFVDFLLKNGADVKGGNQYEEKARKGMNALHYAAYYGSADVIGKLVKAGLKVDSTTEEGVTPLMFASLQNKPKTVKALIRYGADVNKYHEYIDEKNKGKSRYTPLFYAVSGNADKVASILLKKGADPEFDLYPADTIDFTIKELAKENVNDKHKNYEVYDVLQIHSDGVWGFVKKDGSYLMRPQFTYAEHFYDGLAAVRHKGKYGYINKKGVWVIEPELFRAGSFSKGIAPVMTAANKWTLINKKGEHLFKPRNGGSFFFIVEKKVNVNLCPGVSIIYDLKGNKVAKTKRWTEFYSDGLLVKEVLSIIFKKPTYEILDEEGSVVFNTSKGQYAELKSYSEGLLAFKNMEGKWGYLDKKGKQAIPARFDYAAKFKNGLAQVKQNGKFGFINKTGNFKVKPYRSYSIDINEGLYLHSTNIKGKCGYFNEKDKLVIPQKYEICRPFSEGLAAVSETKNPFKYGFINKKGRYIIKPRFNQVFSFKEGFAAVNIK